MTNPDFCIPSLERTPSTEGYVDRIPGMRLSTRARNGRHQRTCTMTIMTDAGEVHRHLNYEDMVAIRDWCDRAIDAQTRALYPDEYPEAAE